MVYLVAVASVVYAMEDVQERLNDAPLPASPPRSPAQAIPSFDRLPPAAPCSMPKLSKWSGWGLCCSNGRGCGRTCGCAEGECWQGR
eukprot:2030637-Pyramimonas_sp.AAC.4